MCTTTARALDYRLEGGLAVYTWKEQLSFGTAKEVGPLLTVGGYVSGYPFQTLPALTLRSDVQMFLARARYNTFSADPFNPATIAPAKLHSTYLGFNGEATAGWQVGSAATTVEPFVGLAYRWWIRYIGSEQGIAGYPELYNTIYGLIGLRGEHRLEGGTVLRTTLSVNPMLWAQELVDLTGTSVSDSTGHNIPGNRITIRNGKRTGWTLEAGLRRGMIDLTAYWKATRFGKSPEVSCYPGATPQVVCSQPDSDQNVIGVRIGFRF